MFTCGSRSSRFTAGEGLPVKECPEAFSQCADHENRLGPGTSVRSSSFPFLQDQETVGLTGSASNRRPAPLQRSTTPNIIGIYDVGLERGVSYMVTELVDGETLRGPSSRCAKCWISGRRPRGGHHECLAGSVGSAGRALASVVMRRVWPRLSRIGHEVHPPSWLTRVNGAASPAVNHSVGEF